MNWCKKGLVFVPDGKGFFRSHAARPIPYQLDEDVIRVFFSSRDYDDRMLPTYIDVDACDPTVVLKSNDTPLVELGPDGSFDDSGITFGSIVDEGESLAIYYTGWKRRRVVSFELTIGVVDWNKSTNTYKKRFEGPIVSQDIHHPFLAAGPFVIKEGGMYRMWYCSGTKWVSIEGSPEPIYSVFYAESKDGVCFEPKGQVIPFNFDGEVVSAPWVHKTKSGFEMYYCYRGSKSKEEKNYKIGFATLGQAGNWVRSDGSVGIYTSKIGWDSEMVCYPGMISVGATEYMFYSGNGVGRGGLGVAVKN